MSHPKLHKLQRYEITFTEEMPVPRATNRTRTGTFQVFSAILWFQNPITDAQLKSFKLRKTVMMT